MTLSRVALTRAQSPDSLGGAALLQRGGSVTLDGVVVDSMSTNHAGGAILQQSGSLTITDRSVDTGGSCAVASRNQAVRLGPLDANGGIARSLLPWADSAGIDAGDNGTCTPLDQRSATRARDAADPCDAGAVEGAAAVAAPPPVVAGVSMTPGAQAARLEATVDRHGLVPTGYEIEYGTTTAYGGTVSDTVPFGPGAGAQPVSLQLGELAPATTYHYRVVATSAAGTVEGPDRTFTTLAADQIAITAGPGPFTAATTVEFRFTPSPGVGGLQCTLTGPGPTGDPVFCADSISYDLADDGTYTFTFSSEPGATFACSIDGGPFAPCTSPAGFGGLAPGTHTLTVRGTEWLVQDSCAGTLTRVARGVVSVRDNVRRKTIVVRAGKKYLARPTGAGRSRAA